MIDISRMNDRQAYDSMHPDFDPATLRIKSRGVTATRKNHLLALAGIVPAIYGGALALSGDEQPNDRKVRRASFLKAAGIDVDRSFGPKIDGIIAAHIAKTNHPARQSDYASTESDLRAALLSDGYGRLDKHKLVAALTAYCHRVDFPMPTN